MVINGWRILATFPLAGTSDDDPYRIMVAASQRVALDALHVDVYVSAEVEAIEDMDFPGRWTNVRRWDSDLKAVNIALTRAGWPAMDLIDED